MVHGPATGVLGHATYLETRLTMAPDDPPGLSISLRGADASLKQLRTAVSDYCNREQIESRAQRHIKVIVDELLSNMLLHATAVQGQDLMIGLQLNRSEGRLRMVFTDNGQAFNPLEADAPDLGVSLEERQIGGLGLHIIRQLTATQTYEREGSSNILTLTIDL